MRRVVSLFLPTWPTDRLRRQKGHGAPALDEPLVIAGHDGRRRVVMAADHAAQALGVRSGLPLAEAQARVPGLHVATHDPAVCGAVQIQATGRSKNRPSRRSLAQNM